MEMMEKAIEEAKTGVNIGDGGPFGAVIADGDKLISSSHNTVLKDKDPTCHAEMNAIRSACKSLGTHILEGMQIYTTAEPCPMCLSAIYWARLERVYIGVTRECAALYGFDDALFYEQVTLPVDNRVVPHTIGVMLEECEMVFQNWKKNNGAIY